MHTVLMLQFPILGNSDNSLSSWPVTLSGWADDFELDKIVGGGASLCWKDEALPAFSACSRRIHQIHILNPVHPQIL